MRVSGFTFIRNALKYDYPVVESITSVLPLCDEFVVLVGNSEDTTRKLIEGIVSPKLKIIDSIWDDRLRTGGRVLAAETDKALMAVSSGSDWCFYIQADECIHEKDLPAIKAGMEKYKDDKQVDGLLFNYTHFYGSYDYTGDSRKWYRREIRIVRNNAGIRSYKDAQGFRKSGQKLNVKQIPATIYHYGWVKPPEHQQAKQLDFNRLWHDEEWIQKNVVPGSEFDYSRIDSLAPFTGSHPGVMQKRIHNKNWKFSYDPSRKKTGLVLRLLRFIEKRTGWKPGEYRNYKLV
jgi:hypothetical protein